VEPLPTEERPSWREFAARVTVDFSPLRDHPDYRRLWIGQAVTFVGSEMALVAGTLASAAAFPALVRYEAKRRAADS
jgi:hypothetical protein